MNELDEFLQIIERELKITCSRILQEAEKIADFRDFSMCKQEYLQERTLLSRQFDLLLQYQNYTSLDRNLSYLARLEDFCRLVKPNSEFSIPKTYDLDKGRMQYTSENIITEDGEEYEYSDDE